MIWRNLIIISAMLCFAASVQAATEDLTTYDETDSASDITVTATKADVSTMARTAVSCVDYDFGSSYFGDFDIDFEFYIDAAVHSTNASWGGLIAVGNTDNITDSTADPSDLYVAAVSTATDTFRVALVQNGTLDDTSLCVVDTLYYCTLARSGTVDTLTIYSDAGRTTVVDTLTLDESIDLLMQYLSVSFSRNGTGTEAITYYVQNLEINSVTVQNYQDLTTYEETDSASDITVTTHKSDVSTMARTANSCVDYDFGPGYFGDFSINLEFYIDAAVHSANASWGGIIAVGSTDNITDTTSDSADIYVVAVSTTTNTFNIVLVNNAATDSTTLCAIDTLYYATFARSGTTSTFTIYDDAARTSVVDTLTRNGVSTGHEYLATTFSRNGSGSEAMTFYTQNIEIVSRSSPAGTRRALLMF